MRLVNIRYVKEGSILARPIISPLGNILLQTGVTLTSLYIQRLEKLGYDVIFIEDDRFDDVEVYEGISTETRLEAYKTLKRITQDLYTKENATFDTERLRSTVQHMIEDLLYSKDVLTNLTEIRGYDYYTFHHSVNTTIIALILGIRLGLTEMRLLELGMGVLMHDIGKIKIPDAILNKKGRLTPEEYEEIKRHTNYGFDILRSNQDFSLASAHVALQHQERWDGSGYPRGLKETEIHEFGRITAIADVYEALSSKRVYRDAWQPHEAYEFIIAHSGTYFEPRLVDCFSKSISVYPTGAGVVLSNGMRGNIVKQNATFPHRPFVRIIHDGDKELTPPLELNLAEYPSLMIVAIENT